MSFLALYEKELFIDDNSDGPSAKRAKFSESETAQVIGIKGYIPEAVKLLFESIQV
jgi:hypothetical protein